LAEYRDLCSAFYDAGANLVAVSVDTSEKSEAMRRELQIPFPILSDPERQVVRDWDVYNPRDKGGIAKPAVFIVGPDRIVRFVSVDMVASRVPAAEILRRVLRPNSQPSHRETLFPGPGTFFRALRNLMKIRGTQQKEGT